MRPPIRVTDARDGEILNRGYSYWSQAWVAPNGVITAFVGHADGHPRFFRINTDNSIERLGPLLPYPSTGEGWYGDRDGLIYLCDGPRLRRVNPFTDEATVVMDISDRYHGCRVWQARSSDDGTVHSATVQRITDTGPYLDIGTIVARHGRLDYFAADGYDLDESQLIGTRYLLIKSKPDDDNLFIDLETGQHFPWITKAEGAVGHSDSGTTFVVGADRAHGACVRVDVPSMQRTVLYPTWNMGHISVRGWRGLVSDDTHLFLVALDGSGVGLQIPHGMVIPPGTPEWQQYDYQVHGNLDPSGLVVAYVSNAAGRMDLYLARLLN